MSRRMMHRAGLPALLALTALLPLAFRPAPSEATGGLRSLAAGSAARSVSSADAAKAKAYGQIPLTFVPNRGQSDPRVRFSARGAGVDLAFTSEEVAMALPGADLALRFLGANPEVRVEGEREAPGKVSYLIGADPDRWHTGLPTYREVRYRELWPGIDVVFRGAEGALKYDFVLRPGARVESIRLAYRGTQGVSLDGGGSLQIRTAGGVLTDEPPFSYQEIGGRRVPVESRYELRAGTDGETVCGFALGEGYDPACALTIDPKLAYGTFLGGRSYDEGWGIAVDGAGCAYVTGATSSSSGFWKAPGGDSSLAGPRDAFVTKLDATGKQVLFSTYLGGSGGNGVDVADVVAVDAAGNVVVVGTTSAINFPTTANGLGHPADGGQDDGFVAMLSPDGSTLLYGSYLGGTGADYCWGLALHGGYLYAAGGTASVDFPMVNAFDATLDGGSDAYVVKLDPFAPASLVASSYLGGSSDDEVLGLRVDSSGRAYLTGRTWSPEFVDLYGMAAGAYDPVMDPDPAEPLGAFDSYLAIVRADWTGLEYATFRGGSGSVHPGNSFALYEPAPGEVYVYLVGRVTSGSVPTTLGAYDPSYNGGRDLYFVKLKPDPIDSLPGGPDVDELQYATFLGGSGDDDQVNPAVDPAGNVYILARTTSTNFPVKNAWDTSRSSAIDCVVAKLTCAGSGAGDLVYSSYLGGKKDEGAGDIAVDGSGSAYIVGRTESSDCFPKGTAGYDTSLNGGTDVFVAKVQP